MFNIWWVNVIAFLFLYTVFTQFYKVATISSKNDGALTVLLQFLSGLVVLLFVPFFGIQFPSNIKTYLLLGIACIFYAISDRVNTTARRGLEVSVYSILEHLSTVFVFTWGIIIFKEPFILKKLLGALLILVGNIMVLYKKGKFEWNKAILFSLLGNLTISISYSLDIGISDQFNLPIYVAITLIVPPIILLVIERIKFLDIISEFKNGNKKAIIFICCSWGTSLIAMLRAYQLGSVTTIAPLCATNTLLNVFVSSFTIKEKDLLFKKVFAAVIAIIGIIIIKII